MDQSFLDFADDYFDFVWCRHCLEHSIFPYFTLQEIYRVIKNLYYLLNVSFVLLYVLYYSSSWDKSNEYLDKLNEIYGIFIGIVLIYYFNPYNKGKLNEFHKRIAFSAGILIILTTSISTLIKDIPFVRKIPFLQKVLSVKKMFM